MTATTSLSGIRGEVHNDFRFAVIVDDVTYATFTEFTLPTLTVETIPWKEGGQNTFTHKMPVRVDVGTAKLKHGITSQVQLLNWYMDVMNGDIVKAKRQVAVELYDQAGRAFITWNFRDAYPIKWTGPTLKSDATGIAIEEIEIAHHGFEVTTGTQI